MNVKPNKNIIMIPTSAHGTNPASATMAGFEVCYINCAKNGEVDTSHLLEKCKKYKGVYKTS